MLKMKMKKLRLLLSEVNDRDFLTCWHQNLDLSKLPICSDYKKYDMITFVGGEPMQCVNVMKYAIEIIRLSNPNAKLIMYTSYNRSPIEIFHMLDLLDGVAITIHNQSDVEPFLKLVELLETTGRMSKGYSKILKVDVCKGVNLKSVPDGWVAKSNVDFYSVSGDEDLMRFCDEQDLYLI